LSFRCPELCPANLHATKDIYRMPKQNPDGTRKRPQPDKSKGFCGKGSHDKKARLWHPQIIVKQSMFVHVATLAQHIVGPNAKDPV
jgi:hypothetical protein